LKALDAYPDPTYSNEYIATNYHLVTLQYAHANKAPQIKSVNPNVKVLLYTLAHGTWTWQENWGEIDAHESWFMHDPSGQRTHDKDPNGAFYLMDIRNPEFRAYQIQYLMNYINTYGFDGLAWDDLPGAITGVYDLDPGPDPAAAATWHQDALTFLQEMRQALGPKLLITNSTPTYDSGVPGVDDTDFLAYVDGTAIEGFGHAPWEPYTDVPDQTWDWTQKMAQRNLSADKYAFVLSGIILDGAPTDQVKRWQIFTLASFLLQSDGALAYYQWGPWGATEPNPIFPEMNLDLGAPLGPADSIDGVWLRDFAGGMVVVNASNIPLTVNLPPGLHTLDFSIVTDIIPDVPVAPWTAVILVY
jgi:hypothetical protein